MGEQEPIADAGRRGRGQGGRCGGAALEKIAPIHGVVGRHRTIRSGTHHEPSSAGIEREAVLRAAKARGRPRTGQFSKAAKTPLILSNAQSRSFVPMINAGRSG
jgi:hypothetical protein